MDTGKIAFSQALLWQILEGIIVGNNKVIDCNIHYNASYF